MTETLHERVRRMLHKALRSLRAAENLYDDGDYDFASSWAYYGVFYAMEALLLLLGKTPATHSGVIGEFSKEYVQTSIFPPETGRNISRLFRERQLSDYEFPEELEPQEAHRDIETARNLIAMMQTYYETLPSHKNL